MKDIGVGIATRRLLTTLLAVILVLSLGLTGCQQATPVSLPVASQPGPVKLGGRLSEVAPPTAIQSLGQSLDVYQPQVAIVSPRPDEVLATTTVSARFQVRDLPIFQDEVLGLGPHLHVILDNQPYQTVYDLDTPLVLKDLEPGTHTLRAFATRPWHESFKNDGAYAQVTFHVLTQTATNHPDPHLPLLTYNQPQGRYGAEPILLDFYLTNAPVHLPTAEGNLNDWRIRCTINGESFVLEDWQPVYLKGFKRGDNWIKLEFLNDRGELVLNAFNNPARLIQYEPGGKDTLSRLMRGELSATAAQGMVKQTVTTPAPPSTSPAAKPTPPVKATPVAKPTPSVAPAPIAPPSPSLTPAPVTLPPVTEPSPVASPQPTPAVTATPAPRPEASPSPVVTPAPAQPEASPPPVTPPTATPTPAIVPSAPPSPIVPPAASSPAVTATPPPRITSTSSPSAEIPATSPSGEKVQPESVTESVTGIEPSPKPSPPPIPSADLAPAARDRSLEPAAPSDTPLPTSVPSASPGLKVNRWLNQWRDRLTQATRPTVSPAPPSPTEATSPSNVPDSELLPPTADTSSTAPSTLDTDAP